MTPEELEQILSMGSIDEEIADLLRQAAQAEEAGAATLDRPSGRMVGRAYVADVPGAISGIFQRGQADKKQKAAEAGVAERRSKRDDITKTFVEGMLGKNLDANAGVPTTPRIGKAPAVDTELAEAALALPMKKSPLPGPLPGRAPKGASLDPSVPPPGARPAPAAGAAPPAPPAAAPPAPAAGAAPAGLPDAASLGLPPNASVEDIIKALRGGFRGAGASGAF